MALHLEYELILVGAIVLCGINFFFVHAVPLDLTFDELSFLR